MTNAVLHSIDPEAQRCIALCDDCHKVCASTIAHCLQMGGEHASLEHIRLMLNCSEICQAAANFMLTNSRYQAELCGVCAAVCASCADSCLTVGRDDVLMRTCADVCRETARACREMAVGMELAA